ncbi:hypothetical protein BT63DRAFT_413390 [Microthyrium microscopicum]|uniref:Expansin-like CBD domain-containing protein n=1 Tax=Microthyrium microscopicum TaxID=703497 RepID=A0A6A6U9P1_9PEZI|nr:hypothetical protein BT63DRAFT_413390 [Microthyrium microscopicum]
MVVDQCPECKTHQLDLFKNAFAELGNPNASILDISWEVVECGISTPIRLRTKEGASKHWFSMQVLNANRPIQALEISTNEGSSWTQTKRQPHNYFQLSSGTGADKVSIRLKCANQKQIVVHNVKVNGGLETIANDNC